MARKTRRVQEPVVMFHKAVAQVANSPAAAFPVIYLPKHKVWLSADKECTTWAYGSAAGLARYAVIHVLPGASDFAAAVARQSFPAFIGMALSNGSAVEIVACGAGRIKARTIGLLYNGSWRTFNLNKARD